MFVHDNNVNVNCTVPLLTLYKAAYLQIAYRKLHSATFQQYTLVGIICVIGKKTIINDQHLEPTVVLRQKGSDGINEASRLRRDNVRASYGDIIHSHCR